MVSYGTEIEGTLSTGKDAFHTGERAQPVMPRLSLQASVNEPCKGQPYPAASFFFSAR